MTATFKNRFNNWVKFDFCQVTGTSKNDQMRYTGSNELLVHQPDLTNGHSVLLSGYAWCKDHA